MKNVKHTSTQNTEKSDGVISGALSLTLSALIVKILGLVYKLPLSNMLGDVGMGYFNTAYTVYAFFYLLCTAGVPKAIMILISKSKATGNKSMENRILTVSMKLFGLIGVSIMLVYIILATPMSRFIGNSKAVYSMIAIAPCIFLASVSGVIRGSLNANMLLSDIAFSQVIEGLGKLVFGIVFAMIGNRLNLPLHIVSSLAILGVTLGGAFGFVYLLVCQKNKIPRENIGQSGKNEFKAITKQLFSISVPITVSAAVLSLTSMIDLGLITRNLAKLGYSESQAAALYGNYTTLAVPMFNLALAILSPISVAFLPSLTEGRAKSNGSLAEKNERDALELTCMVSAPITLGLAMFSEEILSTIFKNSNIEIGSKLLVLLTPAILFSSLLMMINTILEGFGYVKAPMISMTIGAISKLVISSLLIKNPTFGISGAPIGTAISYFVALVVSLIIYMKKASKIPKIITIIISTYLPSAVAIILAKCIFIRMCIHFGNLISLILSITLAGAFYGIYLLFTGKILKYLPSKLAKYTNFS